LVALFRTLGILSVAGGLLYMVVAELVLKESHGARVRMMLLMGVLFLAISLAFTVFGRVSAKMAGRRCPRCGKPVLHGHIYCTDHLKEAVNQFRDDQARKGDRG